MFCPNCGKQLADNAKFCDSCGSVLNQTPQQGYAPPQPPPVQPQYAPPVMVQQPQPAYYAPQPMAADPLTAPMSLGAYIGFFLLLCIPLANIVLLFVWAFGSAVNRNKKNLARALLIFLLIFVVLAIIFGDSIYKAIYEIIEPFFYNYSW
jgi:hypothetical protein